jgi:AcrR family transcriptional regulator
VGQDPEVSQRPSAESGPAGQASAPVQASAGQAIAPVQDARLLAAAQRVLEDAGWQGLTIEAVAEAAGLSRVTAWRLGASREALVATLLQELDEDYRRAMWPALVGAGNARQRLDQALDALFDVIDAHLPLLLASDTIFHRPSTSRLSFSEPFVRLFQDGTADESIALVGGSPAGAADLFFNTICWPYVHLRGRHRWSAERARSGLRALVTPALDPGGAGPDPGGAGR